ncbi:Receptor-interacting serine/threonine-protein kinase 4 [Tetrabaena socialis]|uniref:Receptor-interacting serine/threonine-protein kinase 4 n=1 Tax=Tetrabaena socialis TaxID=47790 RepID=A0A2J8AC00_9CHLO|nr:Receptor-interacting serine/threonine-protein kinase 4 [Tetrabaena socialis]|eukprot:PNH10013.1 Receptor-interacting serine/threonine-protein kinase 4 [Tetrabaena socialis]
MLSSALCPASHKYPRLCTQSGATALYTASQQGHTAVVEALLAAGAIKEAEDASGTTALVIASLNGHTAVVQALLAAEADTEATGPRERPEEGCVWAAISG